MKLSFLVRLLGCAVFSITAIILCLCLLFTGKSVEAMIMLSTSMTMMGFQMLLDEKRFPLYKYLQEVNKE